MNNIFWEERVPSRYPGAHWSGSVAGIELFFVYMQPTTREWYASTKLGINIKPTFKTAEEAKAKCERVLISFLNKIGAAFVRHVVYWRKNTDVRSYDGYIGDRLTFTIRPATPSTRQQVRLYREIGTKVQRRGFYCADVAEAKSKANELLGGTKEPLDPEDE